MSLSATYSERAKAPPPPLAGKGRERGIETRALLVIIWLATVATYLATSFGRDDILSTDDAMRLVAVRDLLAGQGWFDLTQYRLSPPDGVAMHWSRLIDLPLALLIRIGELVLPAALAEKVAIFVWPAALLLLFLAGVARLARALGGDAAAKLALIFAALLAPVLQHFRPGAIDHHNAQLVLLVWSLALACRAPLRSRDAALAGALSALSLAIGVEMAPAIAALAATVALHWIVRGTTVKPATIAFALAFAVATICLLAATVPPARYGVAACDALSIVHVVAAAAGGGGLALLAATPGLASPWARLIGAGVLAIFLAALVVLAFPACLGDPYAHLDARLTALWLSNVNEARNVMTMLRDLPQELLPYYGLPAAALVLGCARSLREPPDARWRWITGMAVLAALFIVALWQVRGAAAANGVAAALVPAALVCALPAMVGRPAYLGLSRAALIAALVLNPLALVAFGAAGARAFEAATGRQPPLLISEGPGTCRQATDYAALARLPKGLVLGFIDAGPLLLMETPHAVLAAPYHRNIRGNAAMLDLFLGSPGEARARLAALGVDYVAFCPGAPERHNYAAAAPDGLAAALARGEVPSFLERIPLDRTNLAVYRARN
jgi:hypothetical protein